MDHVEWERCKHWIADALAYNPGTHTLDDIASGIAAGDFKLWPGKSSAAITEIIETPRKRTLCCFLAGGDLRELVDQMAMEMEAWGAAQGCTSAMIIGRDGWVRVLQKSGYRKLATITMKDIGS